MGRPAKGFAGEVERDGSVAEGERRMKTTSGASAEGCVSGQISAQSR